MRQPDTVSSLFWLGFALFVSYEAIRLGLGSANDPGPGFIFFWSGLILALLSLGLFVGSFKSDGAETDEVFEETNWIKILSLLGSLWLYAFFLERLGFVLSTFLLVGFLLRLIEAKRWDRVLAVSLAAALVPYGLFELWLKVRLPRGMFGF